MFELERFFLLVLNLNRLSRRFTSKGFHVQISYLVAVHLPTPQRFQGNKYAVRLEEERLARRGAVRKWRMLLQDPEHARCCTHAQAGSRWQHSAQHQSELDLPPMEAPSGAAPPVRASPSRPKRPQGYARRNDRGK